MVREYGSTSRVSLALALYGRLLVGCHKTLRAYNLVACLLYMLITPREDFKLLLRKDFGSFTLWWSLIISSLLSLAPPPHSQSLDLFIWYQSQCQHCQDEFTILDWLIAMLEHRFSQSRDFGDAMRIICQQLQRWANVSSRGTWLHKVQRCSQMFVLTPAHVSTKNGTEVKPNNYVL